MKTNKELMEMQVMQNEAIQILIAKVEDLEARFEALQNACGDDNHRIKRLEEEEYKNWQKIVKLEEEV